MIVVNAAGMVTKTTLDNTTTAKITSMVSAITVQAKSVVRDLDPINDLKFLRMRSSRTEILIAPGPLRENYESKYKSSIIYR